MQSNVKFLDLTKIDLTRLSNWQRFQLEQYGNILVENEGPLAKFYTHNDGPSTSEQAHIYSLENPMP